jgi:hypothetical protein
MHITYNRNTLPGVFGKGVLLALAFREEPFISRVTLVERGSHRVREWTKKAMR